MFSCFFFYISCFCFFWCVCFFFVFVLGCFKDVLCFVSSCVQRVFNGFNMF